MPSFRIAKTILLYWKTFSVFVTSTRWYVLDVAFWNLVEGTPVHFVEGPHWDSFQNTGGGRDFVWNDDGTNLHQTEF